MSPVVALFILADGPVFGCVVIGVLLPVATYIAKLLEAWHKTIKSWWTPIAVGYFAVACFMIFVGAGGKLPLISTSQQDRVREFLSVPLLLIGISGLIVSPLMIIKSKESNPELAMRCASCNYELRGNVSGTCPECGSVIPNEQKKAIMLEAAGRDTTPLG